MMTVRQLNRIWKNRQYGRLIDSLLRSRPVAAVGSDIGIGPIPAAALAILRLDELGQGHVPIYGTLLREVLRAQQSDGGWGDPAITCLCISALLCGKGHGQAIERGMQWLGWLQKPCGIWPKIGLRRMPEDALISAFILYQLGDRPELPRYAQLDEAIRWFEERHAALDPAARQLWQMAKIRCQARSTRCGLTFAETAGRVSEVWAVPMS